MGGKIAPGNDRQHAGFAAEDIAVPARGFAIAVDPARQRIAVEHRIVGVISILDEQLFCPQREGVDEAVGVVLPDAGIHHDRPGDIMRRGGAQVATHEHLPAAAQMRRRLEVAAVDHHPRGDVLAILQRDAIGRKSGDAGLRADRVLRQFAAQRSVEIVAGKRAIG